MTKIMKIIAVSHGFVTYLVKTLNKHRGLINSLSFFWSSNIKKGKAIGKFHLGDLIFEVRPTDWCAFQEIILENEYFIVEEILKRCKTGNPVILDLGANIGLFSLFTLFLNPETSLLSVEASENTYQMLSRNRGLNGSYDWKTENAAVSNSDGYLTFEEGAVSTSGKLSSAGNTKVKSVRLKSLLEKYQDDILLVKMDIEGAEEDVISDSKNLLSRIKNLIIEIHPNICSEEKVLSILREHYRNIYLLPGRRSSKPLLLATNDTYEIEKYKQ